VTGPQETPATLTDDEIETRPVGSAAFAGDDTDTGDDTGDDTSDTGDDTGDTSDTTDTGDDSGDS
jgi:hypothetical protein